jgi:hypothetical protein
MKAAAETAAARRGDLEHPPAGPECPRCKGPVYRIRRRFADRVLSLFVPVRRYRCSSWACGWTGTLRLKGDPPASGSREEAGDAGTRAAEPSRKEPTMPSGNPRR